MRRDPDEQAFNFYFPTFCIGNDELRLTYIVAKGKK
jgi:hypothetical protein